MPLGAATVVCASICVWADSRLPARSVATLLKAVGGYMNMMGGIGAILSPALTPVLKDELPADLSKAMRWQIIFSV